MASLKALTKNELVNMVATLQDKVTALTAKVSELGVQKKAEQHVAPREHEYANYKETKENFLRVAEWNRDNGNRYVVTMSANKVICRLRSSKEWKMVPRNIKVRDAVTAH